jgi:branched-chain amino acid aminotransferase/4-amino-4-deoxychorismate lyase
MSAAAPPPAVPADDRGFTLGHGLFETLLADRGRLVDPEAHHARMARGCVALRLPAPEIAAFTAAAEAALSAAGLEGARAAVRVSWSAGSGWRGLDHPDPVRPRLIATAAPAPPPSRPLALSLVGVRRNESSPTSRLKTLSYLDNVLARAEARERGADEALMLNLKGQLACAAAGNLFWTRGARLYTPALACGVLDGIVRARVIAAADRRGVVVQEVVAKRFVLARAGAVFVTNSLISCAPVTSLDGAALGGEPPDWLEAVLAEAAASA